ncbi:hypothetical protein Q5Z23_36215, partial [Pseudomonas aeruginosa]|nr:hypothetical protein [Pseudomonas aeruginosa]
MGLAVNVASEARLAEIRAWGQGLQILPARGRPGRSARAAALPRPHHIHRHPAVGVLMTTHLITLVIKQPSDAQARQLMYQE